MANSELAMQKNMIKNHQGTCCDHTEKSGGDPGGGAFGGQMRSGGSGGYVGEGDGGNQGGGNVGGIGGRYGCVCKKSRLNAIVSFSSYSLHIKLYDPP